MQFAASLVDHESTVSCVSVGLHSLPDRDKTEFHPLGAWKWVRNGVGTNPWVGAILRTRIVPDGTITLADLFRRNESATEQIRCYIGLIATICEGAKPPPKFTSGVAQAPPAPLVPTPLKMWVRSDARSQ